MTNDLTKIQIERQDLVDNMIYDFAHEMLPKRYGNRTLDWDISWISEIREYIQDTLADLLCIPDDGRDEFEMEYYPYTELLEEEKDNE